MNVKMVQCCRTLTATESIANAMTNSSETEMGSSTEDVASSTPTPLPSISLDPTLIDARFTRVDGIQGVKKSVLSVYHLDS